jgi:hypothetical protein
MHLSSSSRPARVRRLLAVSAAAVAVMIGPTACEGGALGSGSASGGSGKQTDAEQTAVIVPVGNNNGYGGNDGNGTDGNGTDGADGNDGANGDDGDDGGQPATTTSAPPADNGGAATTTVAPVVDNTAGNTAGNTAEATAAPSDTTTAAPVESAAPTATAAPAPGDGLNAVGPGGKDGKNNGLDVLGRDCTTSNLPKHTGFQESPACVETQMGEVAAEDKLPSLLITAAPETVAVGQDFTIEVSTRNLVRDRFLGAAAGGYYLESSFLDDAGLQRGHFHTACRILSSTTEAPDSAKAPEFFVATQDNEGGAAPDRVVIQVKGIQTAGVLQCTSWAGDGSHRTPMMTRANQTPAIDSVRITVGGAAADATAAPATPVAATESAQVPDPNGGVVAPVQNGATQDAGATTEPAAESSTEETTPATTTAKRTKAPVAESDNDAEARDGDADANEAGAAAGEAGDN